MENMSAVPGKSAMTSFHIMYKSGEYNQMQKQRISLDSEASTCPINLSVMEWTASGFILV